MSGEAAFQSGAQDDGGSSSSWPGWFGLPASALPVYAALMISVPVPRETFRRNANALRRAMNEAAMASSSSVILSQDQAATILNVLGSADREFDRRDSAARKLANFSNEIGFTE